MQLRQMKDSGIKWIGKIPLHWSIMPNKYLMWKKKQICPIYNDEDIISLSMNGVIVRDLDAGGKMPTSFDGYQYIEEGNLLMCLFDIDVTPRCIGLIKCNGLTSPAYSQFVLTKKATASYYNYYYTMLDNDKTLVHLAKNLRHSLTEEQLGTIKMVVPPIKEQQAISTYLDKKCTEIDSLISDIQQQIETLEQYKRSVITEAVTKGLDPDVEMRDSEIEFIGKVPKHWEIRRMKTLGTVRNGLTYTPQDICDENEGTLVLRSSNVQNGKISLNDNVYVSCEIKSDLMVKYGDILICSRNGSRELIGKNAIIKNLNATFGAFMMIFRSESPEYLYCVLNSHVFSYYLGTFFTSTINQLTGFNFGNMKVAFCPNVREQQKIVEYLDKKCIEIDGIITEKKQQIETIEEYKKSLIFEYVTGKKEVL